MRRPMALRKTSRVRIATNVSPGWSGLPRRDSCFTTRYSGCSFPRNDSNARLRRNRLQHDVDHTRIADSPVRDHGPRDATLDRHQEDDDPRAMHRVHKGNVESNPTGRLGFHHPCSESTRSARVRRVRTAGYDFAMR